MWYAVSSQKPSICQSELLLQLNYCLSFPSILPPFLSAQGAYCMTFYMLLNKVKKLFYIRKQKVFSKLFVLFCLFVWRHNTSYLCITRKNVIFETTVLAIDNGTLKGSAAIQIKAGRKQKDCIIISIFTCCNSTPINNNTFNNKQVTFKMLG